MAAAISSFQGLHRTTLLGGCELVGHANAYSYDFVAGLAFDVEASSQPPRLDPIMCAHISSTCGASQACKSSMQLDGAAVQVDWRDQHTKVWYL
jgi:hypothetical protein